MTVPRILSRHPTAEGERLLIDDGGRLREVYVTVLPDGRTRLLVDGRPTDLNPPSWGARTRPAADPLLILSPATGMLSACLVTAGQAVKAGDPVAEAMKIRYELLAETDGVAVLAMTAGKGVRAGDVLVRLRPRGEWPAGQAALRAKRGGSQSSPRAPTCRAIRSQTARC